MIQRLTNREEEIMQHFWNEGPMTVKALRELYPDPRPHFNTLSTMVRMLEEKGFIAHRQDGRGYIYYAAVTPGEIGRSTLRSALSRYFGNSYLRLVSALVKEENVSVEEIRHLLDEIENEADE